MSPRQPAPSENLDPAEPTPLEPLAPPQDAQSPVRQVATPWLTGCHVLLVGIDHEPDARGFTSHSLGIADHLATAAASVTVLSAVAHRPSWSVCGPLRRRRRGDLAISEPGRPRVVRLDYHVAVNQTAITRAAYEAHRLASAAMAAMPDPPDLVLAATPGLGGVVAAARVARRNRAPLVVVVHDLMAASGSPGPVVGALERHALVAADLVAVMSETFRLPVQAYGVPAERIQLLPEWADIERSPLGRRDARAALGWATRGLAVVLTGEMGLKQDLGNVVEAARLLEDRHDVRFMLVGDGNQRRLLEQDARRLPNVRFKDPLDAHTYPLALAAADVFVVNERPGSSDPAAGSLLATYFCAGRPVIAAVSPDSAAAEEIRRSGGAGTVVPAGDPGALADAVRDLVDHPHRRLAMADSALEHARARLAYRSSMTVLDGIVERALARHW